MTKGTDTSRANEQTEGRDDRCTVRQYWDGTKRKGKAASKANEQNEGREGRCTVTQY